jgi:hypothetical protein
MLGAGLSVIGITGFSIYRSLSPVDMSGALSFFSSCWTCGLFNGIFGTLSLLLPKVYRAIGLVIIPTAVALTAIWMGWTLLSSWLGVDKPDPNMNSPTGGWDYAGKFSVHLVKLVFVSALLLAPLPNMITHAFVEPVFNIGLSISNSAGHLTTEQNRNSFQACLIATAVSNQLDAGQQPAGAFSQKLRNNLTCQLGGIHQMTGLGMTVGWTMLNAAFDVDYMHQFLWSIPIFPNIPLFVFGAIIVFLFFMALIPIPMFFLETIIRLSMNLVMMPLMLLGWLFKDWNIMPDGGGNIKKMIDELIRDTVGIAMVGIFVVFSVMFLNAMFGTMDDAGTLATALANNDSKYLIDGLMLENNSVITTIMAGIFIAFFMAMIPQLVGYLFSGVKIPDKYYKTLSDDVGKVWGGAKSWWKSVTK